jgi:hypothetical protein
MTDVCPTMIVKKGTGSNAGRHRIPSGTDCRQFWTFADHLSRSGFARAYARAQNHVCEYWLRWFWP